MGTDWSLSASVTEGRGNQRGFSFDPTNSYYVFNTAGSGYYNYWYNRGTNDQAGYEQENTDSTGPNAEGQSYDFTPDGAYHVYAHSGNMPVINVSDETTDGWLDANGRDPSTVHYRTSAAEVVVCYRNGDVESYIADGSNSGFTSGSNYAVNTTFDSPSGTAYGGKWSNDETLFAWGDGNGDIVVRNSDGTANTIVSTGALNAFDVVWGPNDDYLYAGVQDSSALIRKIDTSTWSEVDSWTDPYDGGVARAKSLTIDENGGYLAYQRGGGANNSSNITVFDTSDGSGATEITSAGAGINGIEFSTFDSNDDIYLGFSSADDYTYIHNTPIAKTVSKTATATVGQSTMTPLVGTGVPTIVSTGTVGQTTMTPFTAGATTEGTATGTTAQTAMTPLVSTLIRTETATGSVGQTTMSPLVGSGATKTKANATVGQTTMTPLVGDGIGEGTVTGSTTQTTMTPTGYVVSQVTASGVQQQTVMTPLVASGGQIENALVGSVGQTTMTPSQADVTAKRTMQASLGQTTMTPLAGNIVNSLTMTGTVAQTTMSPLAGGLFTPQTIPVPTMAVLDPSVQQAIIEESTTQIDLLSDE